MNPSRKRTNKRKERDLRQNPPRGQRNRNPDHSVTLTRHIMPDEMVVPLRYYWSTALLVNAGSRTASHQIQINGVYDLDSSLGSTNAVGFIEMSALYNRYRALRFKIAATFINADAIPTFCAICYTPDSFATNGFNQGYWGNDYVKWAALGQSTGNDTSKELVLSATAEQILGDPQIKFDADYAALTGANPAKLIYAELAVDSGAAALTQTLGALVRFELTIWTRFYQRVCLND